MRYRFRFLVCMAVLNTLCLSGTALSEPAAEKAADPNGPVAQLESLGFPVRYGTIAENLWNIHWIGDPNNTPLEKIEYIGIHAWKENSHEIAQLPEKVFDVLPRFPNLRVVHFWFFSFEPDDLRRLKEIPKLRGLAIDSTGQGSSKSFQKADDLDFLEDLPNLEFLRLTRCNLTNEMINGVLVLKSLKRLMLSGNDDLTHAILPTLDNLPALEHLGMGGTGFALPPMEARRYAARLKSFSYSGPRGRHDQPFSLEDFKEIVTFPRHTWNYPHKTDVPLSEIVALLPGPVTRFSDRRWGYGIRLEGVDEEGKSYSFTISRPLTDADLEAVGQMSELQELSLEMEEAPFTAKGLRQLTGLGKLKSLTIVSSTPLTRLSLAALKKMPSLRTVLLRGIDLDAGSLAWIRNTPQLEELTLLKGTISGDALADLNHAPKLRHVRLGEGESGEPDYSIVLTPPTKPLSVDGLKRLTLVSTMVTPAQFQILGNFTSLESLTVTGPISDEHLRCLTPLKRLSRLTIEPMNRRDERRITHRGTQRLRGVETPLYLLVRTSHDSIAQAMADQFGWRFYGCLSGCCDTKPMKGIEYAIDAGRLKRKQVEFKSLSEDRVPRAVRVRGSGWTDRLTICKQDVPPTADTLCLTDCRVEELQLKGWLPTSIRLWGDSLIGRITVSDVSADAKTELRYYFLEGETELTVPALPHLSRIEVVECPQLESLRLVGFYPNLETVKLAQLGRLKYLAAPYRGDAPKLEYLDNSEWARTLPMLRLLKLPGTAVGNASVAAKENGTPDRIHGFPAFPDSVREADLRDTHITDEWLKRLAEIPGLRVVRIGECTKLTKEGKAAFRKARPDVSVDEDSVHRPEID